MNTLGCIYLITCLTTGKRYVGQYKKQNPIGRWNIHIENAEKGCKYRLHTAIREHGKESFILETLCICQKSSLGNMEAYFAEQFETYVWDKPGGYNMVWCGNQPMLGMKASQETRAKQSIIRKGRKITEDTRIKMKIAQKGRIITEVTKEKLRQANLGKKQSADTIAKKSASRINVPWSEKKRESMVGRKNTEETIRKMSEAQKGRIISEETKAKMKEAKKAVRKVTDEQIVEIRENKESLPQCKLAIKYNVSRQLINNIINYKRGYEL
jgi:group I intron endonuclease